MPRSIQELLNDPSTQNVPEKVIELIRRMLRERDNKSWIGGVESSLATALIDDRADSCGNHHFEAVDVSGRRMTGAARYEDIQTEIDVPDGSSLSNQESVLDPRAIATDPSSDSHLRIESLNQWIACDNETAAAFILTELESLSFEGTCDTWTAALIFAAEDARFEDGARRARIAEVLFRSAMKLRYSSSPAVEQVVWSAIRRYSSIVRVSELERLIPLLTNDAEVDTRLVTIQGIVRMFEENPPGDELELNAIRDRLFEASSKLLDRDVLVPGETAAIAAQAVTALAALGDLRLIQCVEMIGRIKHPWFSRIVKDNLQSLCRSWNDLGSALSDCAAGRNLRDLLDRWAQSEGSRN